MGLLALQDRPCARLQNTFHPSDARQAGTLSCDQESTKKSLGARPYAVLAAAERPAVDR